MEKTVFFTALFCAVHQMKLTRLYLQNEENKTSEQREVVLPAMGIYTTSGCHGHQIMNSRSAWTDGGIYLNVNVNNIQLTKTCSLRGMDV